MHPPQGWLSLLQMPCGKSDARAGGRRYQERASHRESASTCAAFPTLRRGLQFLLEEIRSPCARLPCKEQAAGACRLQTRCAASLYEWIRDAAFRAESGGRARHRLAADLLPGFLSA